MIGSLVHHTSWEMIDLHLKEEKFAQLRNRGISLYAAHEALDSAPNFGTADTLASLLGLTIEGRWPQGVGSYYAIEFPGVKAFAQRVAEEFGLNWEAISEDPAIR